LMSASINNIALSGLLQGGTGGGSVGGTIKNINLIGTLDGHTSGIATFSVVSSTASNSDLYHGPIIPNSLATLNYYNYGTIVLDFLASSILKSGVTVGYVRIGTQV